VTGALAPLAATLRALPLAFAGTATALVGPLALVDPVTGTGFARPRAAAVTLVSFALIAAVVTGAAALTYRWYFRDEVPEGVAALLGVAVVALYLNTTSLGAIAGGESLTLLEPEVAFFNVVALGVAAAVAPAGRYVGDRLAVDVFALSGARQLEGELSEVVRAVGRFTAVTLPPADEIADMDTYDPVPPEKKAELAGKTLIFGRKLTGERLRERLVERVKTEYDVTHVDVDVTDDGTVEYFAVGARAAGIGPTLAPGSAAVAVAADPPHSVTVGDTVQVWRTEPEPRRVATGEVRGVAGDATTVALDESDAEALGPEAGYRLVTLPTEQRADREFASLLRRADETMATVTVGAGSALAGATVGEVGAVVAAVRPAAGSVRPIPARSYAFAAGDLVYLVGRPDALRRLEADAEGDDASPEDGSTPGDADSSGDADESGAAGADGSAPGDADGRTQRS
jgi:hypothetical protein